jgi:hypothetical protein
MIEEAMLIDYLKRETIRHTYTQELTYLSLSNVTAYLSPNSYPWRLTLLGALLKMCLISSSHPKA